MLATGIDDPSISPDVRVLRYMLPNIKYGFAYLHEGGAIYLGERTNQVLTGSPRFSSHFKRKPRKLARNYLNIYERLSLRKASLQPPALEKACAIKRLHADPSMLPAKYAFCTLRSALGYTYSREPEASLMWPTLPFLNLRASSFRLSIQTFAYLHVWGSKCQI